MAQAEGAAHRCKTLTSAFHKLASSERRESLLGKCLHPFSLNLNPHALNFLKRAEGVEERREGKGGGELEGMMGEGQRQRARKEIS